RRTTRATWRSDSPKPSASSARRSGSRIARVGSPTRAVSAHALGAILPRVTDVVRGRGTHPLELVVTDRTNHLPGPAEDERTRRDARPGCDQSAGADQALRADHDAVEDDRAHADEGSVLDDAPVNDRVVADGYPITERRAELPADHVQGGVVLDVRPGADPDGLDVAADHRAEPDARLRADHDVADDGCRLHDERRGVDAGRPTGVRGDHPSRLSAARVATSMRALRPSVRGAAPTLLLRGSPARRRHGATR